MAARGRIFGEAELPMMPRQLCITVGRPSSAPQPGWMQATGARDKDPMWVLTRVTTVAPSASRNRASTTGYFRFGTTEPAASWWMPSISTTATA